MKRERPVKREVLKKKITLTPVQMVRSFEAIAVGVKTIVTGERDGAQLRRRQRQLCS